ncbi:MAG: DUF1801 domain-containing protein [Candidatus Marinimicrobia bacterium]|nr:DUF1801 domain-containing protein [Candidatus Neomarinimicrobiota bacterium]
MSDLKTKPTGNDVHAFLNTISDESKRADAHNILELLESIVGEPAKMWGASIIGVGEYHYKYASGREGDWFLAGFSPPKQALALYLMSGIDRFGELLSQLEKYKTGKGCLYIIRLSDVDMTALEKRIRASVKHLKEAS